jgi:DNA-binding response OmpR family regulator
MAQTILVIEDDADIRRGLCLLLQSRGFATEAAADAVTGHAAAVRTRPALILLDLSLPGGDGMAVLQRLKSRPNTSAIPVIMLTARDPQRHEAAARAAGAVGFFQKPVDTDRLVAAIEAEIGAANAPAAAAPRRTILIVEDDADTRLGLVVRLGKAGYATIWAPDALAALMLAQKEKPDLVLLDLGLPGGDGLVLLERLKRAGTMQTPVIVLSARDPDINGPRALQRGAVAYFHKPADVPALLAAIRTAMGE